MHFSYLFSFITDSSSRLTSSISFFGSWLFVVGTIMAVISPLAGLAQGAGLAAFAAWTLDRAAWLSESSDVSVSYGLSIGFYVAVLSAAMVLLSLVHPVGPGFGRGRINLSQRLITLHNNRPLKRQAYVYHGLRTRHVSLSGPSFSMAVFRTRVSTHKKWFAMVAACLLVSFVLVLYENAFFMERPPLDAVEGGVVLELSRHSPLFPGYSWDDSSLGVSASGSHAFWNLSVDGLGGGAWVAANAGSGSIGPLNLSVTVIDLLGDGVSSQGDRLVLTAQGGTSFVKDVVYTLSWSSAVGTPDEHCYARWSVGFVFHDGGLDSWVSSPTLWWNPWVVY